MANRVHQEKKKKRKKRRRSVRGNYLYLYVQGARLHLNYDPWPEYPFEKHHWNHHYAKKKISISLLFSLYLLFSLNITRFTCATTSTTRGQEREMMGSGGTDLSWSLEGERHDGLCGDWVISIFLPTFHFFIHILSL